MILIDCPPTLGLLTVNALVASTHAMLSTQAQYFSLQGVEQAMEVFDLARERSTPSSSCSASCSTSPTCAPSTPSQTLEALRERFGGKVFEP